MVHISRFLASLLLPLALFIFWGCQSDRDEPPHQAGAARKPKVGQAKPAPRAPAASRTSVHLRVYPDMAVPGKEVVIEVQLVPPLVEEIPRISFHAISDPCEGELEVDGNRLTYHVPADCRGSGITLEARAEGGFGQLSKTVTLDIKKGAHLESVVVRYPLPGDRLWSPIAVRWDRTLYQNQKETLSFVLKRRNKVILKTREFAADAVVELDIPPSPDSAVFFATASGGSEETALLRVYERKIPQWPSRALLVDNFSLPDTNSMDGERVVLRGAGKVTVGQGIRVSAEKERQFTYMAYHVPKKARFAKNSGRMGVLNTMYQSSATKANYKNLRVWLRGDVVRATASPVYVEVRGNKGSLKKFKIKRLKKTWNEYYFPLNRALRKSGESVRKISIFLDSKDVVPPMGVISFGAVYLEPYPKKAKQEAEAP
jgi:hypothetical protein